MLLFSYFMFFFSNKRFEILVEEISFFENNFGVSTVSLIYSLRNL